MAVQGTDGQGRSVHFIVRPQLAQGGQTGLFQIQRSDGVPTSASLRNLQDVITGFKDKGVGDALTVSKVTRATG
jgi:hypothetical protein